MSRGDLTEAEWQVVQELLPAEDGRGRPPIDRRATVNGILWRLRTGAPWRDVPEPIRQLEQHLAVLSALEPVGHLGGSGDDAGREPGRQRTTHDRQHDCSGPSAGRRRKRGTREQAFGRSRGGFTSKVHMVADAKGRPLAFHLTGGEAADCQSYDTLSDLPQTAPDDFLGDKAYDTDAIRADLKARGIRAVIPPKSNRARTVRWNKRLYRKRSAVECNIGHLKANRAIATRYDKTADSFLGMLHLGAIKIWLKFVHRA